MRYVMRRAGIVLMMVCMVMAFMPVLGQGQAHAASIKLSNTKVYLVKGDTFKLKVKGTSAKVKWSSSNKKVATVSKGKIKAKKNGKATITAKVKGKKLKCKVVVQKASKNAKALRAFVLKKGKYDKSIKKYFIEKKYVTMEGMEGIVYLDVYASKGSKKLIFYQLLAADTPAETNAVEVKIDLISGSKGTFRRYWEDHYGEYPWNVEYTGDISTRFDGKGKGLKLKKRVETEVSYDEEQGEEVTNVTTTDDPAELQSYVESVNYVVWGALKESKNHDHYMNKVVNKAGTTMRSIGFSKL